MTDRSRWWTVSGRSVHERGVRGCSFKGLFTGWWGEPVEAERIASLGGRLSVRVSAMGERDGVEGGWWAEDVGRVERVLAVAALAGRGKKGE